ncbi:glycosyltransferase family 39 protein [Fluviibacterium sp. S390]|uniref:glycosyltransferase family 39 protein n=1 Tax=Fluviibacterium sp. S390 TaxID=3415139 RepID=UPI003C7B2DB8
MSGQSGTKSQYAILAGILVLALGLRLIGANAPLWFDELTTLHTHLRLPWSQMMHDFEMNHHYLFSLQAKAAMAVWGEAPWVLRLPSILFGTATVAAVWVLARDVLGVRIAHVSGLLVAMSYHEVWFSQNARGYAELAFWCGLGLIAFLRGMDATRLAPWLWFGGALAAAGFTHLTGTTFFLALGVLWLATVAVRALRGQFTRETLVQPLIGAGLGLVVLAAVYLPMVPSMLDTVGGVSGTSAVDPMKEYQNPLWTVLEGVRTALGSGGGLTALVALAVLVVCAAGAWRAHPHAPLFAPAVVLHIVVTIGLLMAVHMRIWPRFFFVDIGLMMILIVAGVAQIADWIAAVLGRDRLGPLLWRGGVLAMVLISAVLLSRNYLAPKQDLAGALAYAESQRQPGERVYSLGPGGVLYRSFFGADWGEVRTSPEYMAMMEDPSPVLLVVPFPQRVRRAIPEFAVDQEGVLQELTLLRGTLGDGNIVILRRP